LPLFKRHTVRDDQWPQPEGRTGFEGRHRRSSSRLGGMKSYSRKCSPGHQDRQNNLGWRKIFQFSQNPSTCRYLNNIQFATINGLSPRAERGFRVDIADLRADWEERIVIAGQAVRVVRIGSTIWAGETFFNLVRTLPLAVIKRHTVCDDQWPQQEGRTGFQGRKRRSSSRQGGKGRHSRASSPGR
jgi:hypothetical protein